MYKLIEDEMLRLKKTLKMMLEKQHWDTRMLGVKGEGEEDFHYYYLLVTSNLQAVHPT